MDYAGTIFDVIVVGAGIEGSSTAYNLAKCGKRTLLLEQFPLPHSRGSSHGQSRITRKAYGDKDFYTQMMSEAYSMIDELQNECGERLFVNCGCLVICPVGNHFLTETKNCLKRYGIQHDNWTINEQRKRFPRITFPDNYEFILDKSGGLLKSDKILQAFQSQFVRYGGVLHDGEPMVDLKPGTIVTVQTTNFSYQARSIVLTLGLWASQFLPRLGLNVPLQPQKITVCYWKDKNGGNDFSVNNFPTFTMDGAAGKHHIYGLPASEYPGMVKICLHTGPNIDPDNRDGVDDSWVLDIMKVVISSHFPTLMKDPSIVETCIYTNTPDSDFVLDVHPKWNNIVIGAGFSGHGFKLSPVVGKVLGELATGQVPSYDLSHFKIDRFFQTKL